MYKYFIFSCFLLLVSCNDDEVVVAEKNPLFTGVVNAEQNGVSWEACSFTVGRNNSTDIDIRFNKIVGGNFILESLDIQSIALNNGVYNLNKGSLRNAIFAFKDHDAPLARYDLLDEGFTNTVKVNSFDAASGLLMGSFDLTFLIKEGWEDERYPDTVRFREGVFDVVVE